MLVIKAEIWPQGSVAERFEIARIGIINRGNPADSALADYNVISLLGRDKTEHVAEGFVLGYARHHGWRLLASQALREHGPSVLGPSIFHPEYTQTVIDLLKRG